MLDRMNFKKSAVIKHLTLSEIKLCSLKRDQIFFADKHGILVKNVWTKLRRRRNAKQIKGQELESSQLVILRQ